MQNKKKQKFQQQREKIQVRETITSEDTPEVIVKETTEADVHETVKKNEIPEQSLNSVNQDSSVEIEYDKDPSEVEYLTVDKANEIRELYPGQCRRFVFDGEQIIIIRKVQREEVPLMMNLTPDQQAYINSLEDELDQRTAIEDARNYNLVKYFISFPSADRINYLIDNYVGFVPLVSDRILQISGFTASRMVEL
jgi:hypothetical protein